MEEAKMPARTRSMSKVVIVKRREGKTDAIVKPMLPRQYSAAKRAKLRAFERMIKRMKVEELTQTK